jgi:aryl-alcohol dehydrogenase-like predicted oxidoreductase
MQFLRHRAWLRRWHERKAAWRGFEICARTDYYLHKVLVTQEGANDFSTKAIRPSIEASMRRLQTDYLDIVLMHNPPREMDAEYPPNTKNLKSSKPQARSVNMAFPSTGVKK